MKEVGERNYIIVLSSCVFFMRSQCASSSSSSSMSRVSSHQHHCINNLAFSSFIAITFPFEASTSGCDGFAFYRVGLPALNCVVIFNAFPRFNVASANRFMEHRVYESRLLFKQIDKANADTYWIEATRRFFGGNRYYRLLFSFTFNPCVRPSSSSGLEL